MQNKVVTLARIQKLALNYCVRGFLSERSGLVESETISGGVYLIGVNKPEARNSLDHDVLKQLAQQVRYFERNEALLVAVLHGKGGNFSVGYDVTESTDKKVIDDVVSKCDFTFLDALERNKPIIAAIDGYALGAGMELACMCDLRVMEDTAQMGLPRDSRQLPLSPNLAFHLSHLIGLSRAMDLVLTGRPINGVEAFQMGLSNVQVATGTAIGRATQVAGNLARFPQTRLRHDRKILYDNSSQTNSKGNNMNIDSIQG